MTPEAISELYEAEREPLTRSVERIVGDRASAEDMVHDAFVSYLASPPDADRPGAWLSRVARNRALNHIRRAPAIPLADDPPGEGYAAEGGPERDAVTSVVSGALGAIGERDRLALQLRFYEGLEYPQVALRLGVRVEQTHVIVHRAVRRLGREVVRRLAVAHGAASCENALAGMLGLAAFAGEHGETPCDRCRSAWDEITALRALPSIAPLAAAPGFLRRVAGRMWARTATLGEPVVHLAGAAVGVAVVAASLVPSGAMASVRPAGVTSLSNTAAVHAPSGIATSTRSISSARTTGVTRAPSRVNDAGTTTDLGGVNITSHGDHTQVEPPSASQGGSTAGVVVCQPLQPCPPPPSPRPEP